MWRTECKSNGYENDRLYSPSYLLQFSYLPFQSKGYLLPMWRTGEAAPHPVSY